MSTPQDAKTRAALTYNAASDHYDDSANSFWGRFGRRTIERLGLKRGARVLDVCSGSGASAIPAAETVGPEGRVIGIDLADDLLKLARAKAKNRGLENLHFEQGDLLDLGFGDSEFDDVVCVFGIFFVPDMPAAVRELWRLVKPHGKLALTTWGPNFFEPASTAFWNSIRDVRPDLYKGFNPWDRICDPISLRALFNESRIETVEIETETNRHDVSPDAWWSAVMGSGYRGTIDQLSDADREQVRGINYNYIVESGIQSVEANVVYGVATKL